MQHKCKVTVIDKKLYPELQQRYCADPQSGPCPCYNVGDEFVFERYGAADDFWHIGAGTLRTPGASGTAGGRILGDPQLLARAVLFFGEVQGDGRRVFGKGRAPVVFLAVDAPVGFGDILLLALFIRPDCVFHARCPPLRFSLS